MLSWPVRTHHGRRTEKLAPTARTRGIRLKVESNAKIANRRKALRCNVGNGRVERSFYPNMPAATHTRLLAGVAAFHVLWGMESWRHSTRLYWPLTALESAKRERRPAQAK
jgi:hypothetical protein